MNPQAPENKDTVSAKGVSAHAKAVNKSNYPDAEGEAFKGVNNEILDIWMNDIRSTVGMQSLEKLGTAIPYIFNIAGDLLINPSTVSPSTFKKMVESDDVIKPAILNTINAIINTIGGYVHDNKDVQAHIRWAILQNNRGFRTMCRDILTALYAGFSRQECIWGWDDQLGADIVTDTVPLPQNSLIYRIDPYGDMQEEGVGQYVFNSFYPGFSSLFSYGMGNVFAPLLSGQPNNFFPNSYSGFQGAGGYPSGGNLTVDPYASLGDMDTPYRTYLISPIGLVWMPTNKTIGFEYYDVTNNKNPYGKSALRSAYNLWLFKLAVLEYFLEMLKKKSAPLLVGYSRPDVPTGPMNPNNPNQFINNGSQPFAFGSPMQSATYSMSQALAQANSSAGISLAGMKGEVFDLEAIQIQGELNIFLETIKWVNECILTCLMTPKTTFGGDGKGSYALSYSQSGVHERFVMSVRADLIDCLLKQYIGPMIEEAFLPEEYGNDFGTFDIERSSIDEQVKLMTVYKPAIDGGFVSNKRLDDINKMRESIGFSKLEESELEEFLKEIEEAQEQMQPQGKEPLQKREKMDSAEKPYEHHKDK